MAALAQQMRAVGDAVGRQLAAVHVENRDFARARQRNVPAARIGDRRHVAELDRPIDRGFEVRLLVELGGAADVEGPHRQLGARLADRLGGDHADRLADVDRGAAREIAPVASGADTLARRAHQRRADFDALKPDLLDLGHHCFIEKAALLHDDFAALGVDDVLGGGAAEHAIGERRDDCATLDDGTHFERLIGSAIFLDDHGVLRHVDQAAGQVTRVRRLERRVGEALAGAVGRVEVLEDGQAFLEVRDDRSLDDLARGLGHEAAHSGELLDLRLAAAGA